MIIFQDHLAERDLPVSPQHPVVKDQTVPEVLVGNVAALVYPGVRATRVPQVEMEDKEPKAHLDLPVPPVCLVGAVCKDLWANLLPQDSRDRPVLPGSPEDQVVKGFLAILVLPVRMVVLAMMRSTALVLCGSNFETSTSRILRRFCDNVSFLVTTFEPEPIIMVGFL